jgi:hypothetical protein
MRGEATDTEITIDNMNKIAKMGREEGWVRLEEKGRLLQDRRKNGISLPFVRTEGRRRRRRSTRGRTKGRRMVISRMVISVDRFRSRPSVS